MYMVIRGFESAIISALAVSYLYRARFDRSFLVRPRSNCRKTKV